MHHFHLLSAVLLLPLTLAIIPTEFLDKYGYLSQPSRRNSGLWNEADALARAIRMYQQRNGLRVTGTMNRETREWMQKPRCGVPDVIDPLDPNSPMGYQAPGLKWRKTDLTYYIDNYSPDMNDEGIREAIRKGFQHWSNVTPMTFRQIDNRWNADIRIGFNSGEHGDGAKNAFDGQGGTLAHAFFPRDGRLHFDESETWTENSYRGTNLEIVAAHEIGHSLGLAHSSIRRALMFPTYLGYNPSFQLHTDDIEGIQSLYGGRRADPTPAPVPSGGSHAGDVRPRPEVPASSPDRPAAGTYCDLTFDATVVGHDGVILAFKDGYVYRLSGSTVLSRRALRDEFPRLPSSRIDGAIYSKRQRSYMLFTGGVGYRYSQSRVLRSRLTLPSTVTGITSTLYWYDGNVIIFTGSQFYSFNERRNKVYGPQRTSRYFRNMPLNIDASFLWRDKFVYLFKGGSFYKMNPYKRSVEAGYPRRTADVWLGCGSSPSRLAAGEPVIAERSSSDPRTLPLTPPGGWENTRL